MRRRAWAAVAAAVLVAGVTGATAVVSGAGEAAPAAGEAPASTATVERGSLSDRISQAGTLTFRARSDGSPFAVINRADGVYTALPEEGERVRCGDVLYRVDDEPVLLLCGAVPAYRDLGLGDAGKDVRQLNRNLRALGHGTVAAGNVFTARTGAALARLQDRRGLDATGALALADAVFVPHAVRVAGVAGELGGSARPGAPVLGATSEVPVVQVSLDPSQRSGVAKGDRAQISLPDNTLATGRVDRVGRVARAAAGQDGGAGSATIPVSIGLDDPAEARGLDKAPVQVDITTEGVRSALSVPVTAIVGHSGGFAVEVVGDDGRREVTAVRLGLFDTTAGRVQVEGELAEGDHVVVPSL
ncbi:MAG TPA: peptidoglycan-binding protein [Solirubrobacteraceae bacterium]|nr:peptidoglycan-binding protein [Solirubrobacteraceae bacterium]